MSERDQERLNRFPTPSNLIQIMSKEIYDGTNMNIFKDHVQKMQTMTHLEIELVEVIVIVLTYKLSL